MSYKLESIQVQPKVQSIQGTRVSEIVSFF